MTAVSDTYENLSIEAQIEPLIGLQAHSYSLGEVVLQNAVTAVTGVASRPEINYFAMFLPGGVLTRGRHEITGLAASFGFSAAGQLTQRTDTPRKSRRKAVTSPVGGPAGNPLEPDPALRTAADDALWEGFGRLRKGRP